MGRELPITFNTEMVNVLLKGENKIATRRKVKELPHKDAYIRKTASDMYSWEYGESDGLIKPPYKAGDILYVCETWSNANKEGYEPDYYYFADMNICEDYDESEWLWHAANSMPKEAARIWLQVTSVRLERLHKMTLDDFLKEGIELRPEAFNDPENAYLQGKREFEKIWNNTVKINEMVLYGWEANPWVWAIEFKRCKKMERNNRK